LRVNQGLLHAATTVAISTGSLFIAGSRRGGGSLVVNDVIDNEGLSNPNLSPNGNGLTSTVGTPAISTEYLRITVANGLTVLGLIVASSITAVNPSNGSPNVRNSIYVNSETSASYFASPLQFLFADDRSSPSAASSFSNVIFTQPAFASYITAITPLGLNSNADITYGWSVDAVSTFLLACDAMIASLPCVNNHIQQTQRLHRCPLRPVSASRPPLAQTDGNSSP